MSIEGQGHSLTLVKGHSDFKVKCLTFGLYTQVSDSGPLGPLVLKFADENFVVCFSVVKELKRQSRLQQMTFRNIFSLFFRENKT